MPSCRGVALLPHPHIRHSNFPCIDWRYPARVDSVDDTVQTAFLHPSAQQSIEAAAVFRCGDLVCVGPTDRRHVGRIVDPGLEKGNLAMKFRPVDGERMLGYAKIAEAG